MSFIPVRKLDKAHQASHIHPLRHGEAETLAGEELARFVGVLESLGQEEWATPTAFAGREAGEVGSHVAKTCTFLALWSEFKHPHDPRHLLPEALHLRDMLNHSEAQPKSGEPPAQVLGELRRAGPEALETLQHLSLPLRALPIPAGATGLHLIPLGHLTDFLFTVDVWLHRLDICLATGREMVQTLTHDGRLVELVLRELAHNRKFTQALGETAVALALSGPAGGWWWFGHNNEAHLPVATVRMLALDFLLLVSGRLSLSDTLGLSTVRIEGDPVVARRFLDNTPLPL